ncbi:unnamed protein product [Rotaria sp. Silwood1]|nr:unnamed protein product [Rotaria sp. Silwood1]
MAFKPHNYETTNDSIDFDQILFPSNDFHNAYESLILSEGVGTLNTPTLEINNSFIQWIQEQHSNMPVTAFQEFLSISTDQELTVPSENINEEFQCVLLDIQINDNGIKNNVHQSMDVHEEEGETEEVMLQNGIINQETDRMDVQAIVNAIYYYDNPIMRMHTQPVARHHIRYRTDGIRYLEQSRRNPMSIEVLPILNGCLTKVEQSFWLELTLVTTQQNPQHKRFLHQHEMINNEENVEQNGLGSFRVLLTEEEIRRQRKIFRHLSIMKTRLNNYTFQLIPFDPFMEDNHVEAYTLSNEERMTKVQKAKCFDQTYHTNQYQIVCQLIIKQNDQCLNSLFFTTLTVNWLDDTDIDACLKDIIDGKDSLNVTSGFKFGNGSIVPTELVDPLLDSQLNIDAILKNEEFTGDEFDQILVGSLPEETIVSQDNNQENVNENQKKMSFEINTNQFACIDDVMTVKEQPKPDQRARYESDGPRFLPDSKKHPMSIELPDLSLISLPENASFGIVLTMVTSTKNPRNKTFVHVNGIKYRTEDAIEIGCGSIFLPLTKSDILKCEKKFPRLSIICKKFEDYTFDLTSFNLLTVDRITEKYTLTNEDDIGKVAKGKQLTIDYDLLCYKIIFQLALKQENIFMISNIKCETEIINEQKAAKQGVKRKASSNKKMPKKRKGNICMAMINPPKKFNSSKSTSNQHAFTRKSNCKINQVKGSSVDSS